MKDAGRTTPPVAPPQEAIWPTAAEIAIIVGLTWVALAVRTPVGASFAASWTHGLVSILLFGTLFVIVSLGAILGVLGIAAIVVNFLRAMIGR